MADSKSPNPGPSTDPSATVRRTASTETLPQYTPSDDDRRTSLEDAAAPLPDGWFCHLDPNSGHHYYVDMNTTPPRSVWQHPRHGDAPPPAATASSSSSRPPAAASSSTRRQSFLGKLKEKMVVSAADREAEEQRKAAQKEELLARYAKRRSQVLEELQKDGGPGKTQFGVRGYVGPPASPYGGTYRALMPALGANNDLVGWM
ncbi:hypothetical protein C8R43DRAFT_196637 [Mycena crocata]|nr:hypothetical protein C8R43DRAFT_196637 [Mycena crocata]